MTPQISISRVEDVEKLWMTQDKEYSHRIVTTKRQGCESMSIHVTTYAANFTDSVSGDGVHEVVMYCTEGGATITPKGEEPMAMTVGAALYLPREFAYDLTIGNEGMTVVVACNPPKE